jgi:predicted transglutaminase-like cysteine proteinase
MMWANNDRDHGGSTIAEFPRWEITCALLPHPTHANNPVRRAKPLQRASVSGPDGRSISPWHVELVGCLVSISLAAFGNPASLFASGISSTAPGATVIARDDSGLQRRAHARTASVTPVTPLVPLVTFHEPFGVDTVSVVSGGLWNTWRGVRDAIRADSAVLARCRINGKQCPPVAKNFLAIIAEGRAHTGRARIGVINRAINLAIHPKSDPYHWKAPLESLSKGSGDCKDYAIAKYVALMEAGIPQEDLRLVIVRDLTLGQDHAVVAARLDRDWIMLDNRWLTLVHDVDMRRVNPLFVLDRDGVRQFSHDSTYSSGTLPFGKVARI